MELKTFTNYNDSLDEISATIEEEVASNGGLLMLGIPNEIYHALPFISNSGLSRIAKSPRHFQHDKKNPKDPTKAMRIGSAFHMLTLEEELFNRVYSFDPTAYLGLGRSKDDLALKEEILSDPLLAGVEFMPPDEWERLYPMRDSVLSKDKGRKSFCDGFPEVSIFWTDPKTGVLCKARADWLKNNGTVIDLKSTADASPSQFIKSVVNFRYHVQQAFYVEGLQRCGISVPAFIFCATESTQPHDTAFYELPDILVERGDDLWRRDLDTYAACLQDNEWQGYADDVVVLDAPAYAFYD